MNGSSFYMDSYAHLPRKCRAAAVGRVTEKAKDVDCLRGQERDKWEGG